MTKEQINKLVSEGVFPGDNGKRTLIETHISWVIVCDHFVYKIKKPVHYSFLDFSTLELRKHFCEREIELNKRLTEGIYLDVQPIYENEGNFVVGGKEWNCCRICSQNAETRQGKANGSIADKEAGHPIRYKVIG